MIRDARFQYIVNYSDSPRLALNETARKPDDAFPASAATLGTVSLIAAHPEHPQVKRFTQLIQAPRPREELYDCVADPDQLENLADAPALAEVKRSLRARLEAYQRQTNDPRITGDMTVFEETLKFVQGRKSVGYSDTRTPSKKNVPIRKAVR